MRARTPLEQLIEKHELWLSPHGREGARACARCLEQEQLARPYFDRNDLRDANFSRGKRGSADFGMSDLSGVSFEYSYLREADLRNCTAGGTNFEAADLTCFCDAKLLGADFMECNLEGADLRTSEMDGINLQGAYVCGIRVLNPIHLLLGEWGEVSDELNVKLMRFNASAWNGGREAYDHWRRTGEPPWRREGLVYWGATEFEEKPELWSPGPPPTVWEAVNGLLTEKCKGWGE